jgi:uncharacterized membrane protein YdbT with pleckstrin-like domain
MKIKSFLDLFIDSNDSFEGQEKGEGVILILRRHVFVIYSQLAVFLIAIFVPVIIGKVFQGFISANNLFTEFIFLNTIWYMFCWILVFYSLTMYSLNVVIITNHRIIDSNQSGFFNRKISELHLGRVQDISVHTRGFIETLLKFGTIEVQTASEQREFIFHQIPNPERVKDVIMDQVAIQNKSHHDHL